MNRPGFHGGYGFGMPGDIKQNPRPDNLFYSDRTGDQSAYNVPNPNANQMGGPFVGPPGYDNGPRFHGRPRPPPHGMPSHPEDSFRNHAGPPQSRYSPNHPAPGQAGYSGNHIRPPPFGGRRDMGRGGGRGGGFNVAVGNPGQPHGFRPSRPGTGGPRPFMSNNPHKALGTPTGGNFGHAKADINRVPPPPDASFDFHPDHWVVFSGPPSLISQMPPNSRLFMGNLASERTDRRELARIFAVYGNIAEIVLKGSYGFIQFDSAESCGRAMQAESGRKVAGMSIDLKISRDRRKEASARRGNEDRGSGGRGGRGRGTDNRNIRDDDRRGRRDSDEWRREDSYSRRDRSSSYSSDDSSGSYHRRDSRDSRSHDEGRGSMSQRRSVSPMQRQSRWGQERSPARKPSEQSNLQLPTPTMSAAPTGSGVFPLPVRFGNNVPECQIIVLKELDRAYLGTVEQTLRAAGVIAQTLHLAPKMNLRDVVHQMIAEGVRGVIFLDKSHVIARTVSMQIFQGNGVVAEYDKLSPQAAAQLFIQDRTNRPVVPSQFNASANLPLQQSNPLNGALAGMLSGLLGGQSAQPAATMGGLDATTLLTLVSALQQQQQQQQNVVTNPQLAALSQLGLSGANPLAALGLGGMAGLGNMHQQPQQQQAPSPVQQAGTNQPNLAAMLSSMLSQQSQQGPSSSTSPTTYQQQQSSQRPPPPNSGSALTHQLGLNSISPGPNSASANEALASLQRLSSPGGQMSSLPSSSGINGPGGGNQGLGTNPSEPLSDILKRLQEFSSSNAGNGASRST
ncbi:hypothetical protein DFS34DRAFT_180130 [Phlyctochytrium arcticum]|nr:hypothetical protein DFS34DRAFT_180130 [Phlyctochytrium arcticum]